MDEIALVFRKKQEGRQSIEGVFEPMENLSNINKIELPCELNSIANAFKLFLFSIKIKEKIVHITGDIHYMAIFLFWKRIIITMHDANHYEDIYGMRKKLYSLIWFKIPIRLADKIIFISPFAAAQMQNHFKIRESKIEIIPNSFKNIDPRRVQKESSFTILIIGTKPNKNLGRLIEAVEGIQNIKLFIVGKLQNEDVKMLDKVSISYQDFFNVSDERLQELYNLSDMLFFASTKEGFGLPILEAQSCGLPVLTSETTSMPYVAGDAALIVNPFDVNEIRQAILLIKDNIILRQSLIKKGYINIKRFDEATFVNSYKQVYESIK